MDCKTARLLLDFARPLGTELEESEGEALAGHLADCSACGTLHRVERKVDDHIGKAMRAVPVPDGLRDRIVVKLAGQRDRWYLRRVGWGAAAAVAAAVLLTFTVTYLGRKPEVDLAGYHAQVNILPTSPEEVGSFLKRPALLAPTQFNYRNLVSCSWADFQGRKVPQLVFRRGTELATVYILNDRQFDLKSLENQGPLSGGQSVSVLWPTGGEKHTAYVVVFTGGSLEPFFARPIAPL